MCGPSSTAEKLDYVAFAPGPISPVARHGSYVVSVEPSTFGSVLYETEAVWLAMASDGEWAVTPDAVISAQTGALQEWLPGVISAATCNTDRCWILHANSLDQFYLP